MGAVWLPGHMVGHPAPTRGVCPDLDLSSTLCEARPFTNPLQGFPEFLGRVVAYAAHLWQNIHPFKYPSLWDSCSMVLPIFHWTGDMKVGVAAELVA